MRLNATGMGILIVGIAVLSTPAIAQGPYGFLKNSPVAYFNEQDFALMREAAQAVLQSDAAITKSWRNQTSGNSGTIRAVKNSESPDGRPCKTLQVDNQAKGIKGSATYLVCRSAEGVWQFDYAAR